MLQLLECLDWPHEPLLQVSILTEVPDRCQTRIFMHRSHCRLHWQPCLLTRRERLHLEPPPEHSSAQLSRGPQHQASNRNAFATFCVYCGRLTTSRMPLSGVLEFHICKCQQTLTAASQPHPATLHTKSNIHFRSRFQTSWANAASCRALQRTATACSALRHFLSRPMGERVADVASLVCSHGARTASL
jgi:hypothetical protein